ncbi:hypothetical protein BLA24_11715 [Streptomyces cinnamoneus]|uniref:RamC N-terminal domain-containing protein n=1 Tax=Streptomyces cinnamoneus TaxID=53446 RepID=A0A2G1XKJ2_STRCJ|nr:class III lanthionine synthetase LanKC [Streptomyces cinnamoneus]PHQ51747.1 hypothetical protein BLA24_11715 [Streptomyces cinnamoneus]PPT11995.1 serine/threonine protein kinase [Streptomyces cinnamoneus]
MLTLKDYDRFCLADPDFYELPERYPDDHDRFPAALRRPPRGWERDESGWRVALRPAGAAPPAQGWRVHVSVTLPHLARAVETVWDHCTGHGLAFDFVRSPGTARETAGEHGDRLAAGRLITVRPADEAALVQALRGLGALLAGLPGPYVLGALRHGDGPLYTEYAATGGRPLRRPDGTAEPHGRRAVFTVPDWLPLPHALRPDLRALHAKPAGHFPYRVERALRLRPGGGTYLAAGPRGAGRVVLREARPHAGVDRWGEDAVARLARERGALERLAGLDCVPRLTDHRRYGEHHYLAREYVEGTSLQAAAALAFPLTSPGRAARESGAYAHWALGVLRRVEQALIALWREGLRLGELHPERVLLRPDGRVVLTGLDSATHRADDRPSPVGEAGFTVPAGRTGADATRWLLDRLRLWLFLPVPHRGPAQLRTLTAEVQRHYPLPPGFGAALLRGLRPPGRVAEEDGGGALFAAERPHWPALRDALVRGIHACATPDRPDRLFPGTPFGRRALGGPAFAHGAAGVLHALHRVGAPVPAPYVTWLVTAATADPGPRPGLYDGLHGVALVLDELGRRQEALALLDRCRAQEDRLVRADLYGGAAGVALTLLRFASLTRDTGLYDRALRLTGALVRLLEDGPPAAGPGDPAPYGLLHGATGVALLFLRWYERTGEARWLERADRALAHDLARLVTLPDQTVALFDGTTHQPYLQGGGAGCALVLRELLVHRPDPARTKLLAALRRSCDPVYVRNAGLLRGRAGAVAVLAALGEGPDGPAVLRQVRRLGWYAQTYRGHLVFPGFRMLRLSSDLATGAAGVLLALGAAFERTGPVLPFLDKARPVAVPPRRGGERRVGDPGTAGVGGGAPRPVAV